MVCSAQPLNELTRGMTKYPQTLVNVRMEEKVDVLSLPKVVRAVAEAEARLADSGRVLLRPSGTEPVVRDMVEGRDRAIVEELANELACEVQKAARQASAGAAA